MENQTLSYWGLQCRIVQTQKNNHSCNKIASLQSLIPFISLHPFLTENISYKLTIFENGQVRFSPRPVKNNNIELQITDVAPFNSAVAV